MGRKKKYEAERFETPVKGEHFTRLYDTMLKSDAWKDLNHASRSVYLILKMQYKGDYTGNTVMCPYKVFQEYGMNTSTVKKAITDLTEHGFIRCDNGIVVYHEGSKTLHRTPNEYTFVSEWIKWKCD